jgi:EAL domain-containing protein (putative c-di-GMP-specific phosphodiesterase class I)
MVVEGGDSRQALGPSPQVGCQKDAGMPWSEYDAREVDPGHERAPRSRLAATALAVTALGVVWWAAYISGGSRTSLTHLFYVPVVLAGLRLGLPGAAGVAGLAAVLAGPGLPLDVDAGEPQPTWNWLLRGVVFLLIGVVTSWLSRSGHGSLRTSIRDARISARLRHAVRRGDLEVHYQPIIDLDTGVVVGLEALARWTDPILGPVSPSTFIPVAESSALIDDVDRYVLGAAARQVMKWSGVDPTLTLSVNVSATRFADPRLLDDVDEALAMSGLDPHRLQLEITETAVIGDIEGAASQISMLQEKGVRVAVDDFGVGRTSLGYLAELGVDTVKLDRTLVSRAAVDPQSGRLLAGLVSMFGYLGVQVVVEGISTPEEYLQVASSGCSRGQGFFLARPAAPPKIQALLVDQARTVHRAQWR